MISISYYVNKAPAYMRPVLSVYVTSILEKEIQNIDSYFRIFLTGDYDKTMETIIRNLTPAQAIDAANTLESAWAATNQQNMEEQLFKKQFLGELWSILLNVALATIKVV